MSDVIEALAGAWLEPISRERPAGDPAQNDPRYVEIVAAMGARNRDDRAPASYPLSFRVATAGKDLLRTRTKDLRIAAYVAFAELGLPGSDNLARGLALLAGLMERYWDSMHPPIDAMDERVSALAWFVDRAHHAVDAPASGPRAGSTTTAMRRFSDVVQARVPDEALLASIYALRTAIDRSERHFETSSALSTQVFTQDSSILDDLLQGVFRRDGDSAAYSVVNAYGSPAFFMSIRDQIVNGNEIVDRTRVDQKIGELDAMVTTQVNEILHHPEFQRLEAAWRGLWHVVEQVDARDRVELAVLHVTQSELFDDLLRGPDASRLHDLVHDEPYVRGATAPYALLVGDFAFGPDDADMALLERVATLAARVHAPFLAAASPSMFELDAWRELPAWLYERFRAPMTVLPAVLDGRRHVRWRAFRERDEAAWVGLCLPRFLLRPPYDAELRGARFFAFMEDVRDPATCYLWGNVAFALAARAACSFVDYGWCANIIGPSAGGAVEGLASHRVVVDGEMREQPPVECALTERGEYLLSESGFIGLATRGAENPPCFFSASSCREPPPFPPPGAPPDERQAAMNERLDAQLPHTFLVARIAHYLHVQSAELLRRGIGVDEVARTLRDWLAPHAAILRDPAIHGWGRCFLRTFRINGALRPDGARFDLEMQPNFNYMGSRFLLPAAWTIPPRAV